MSYFYQIVGPTHIEVRGGSVNDVLTVPDDVWEEEKNYTGSHPDLRHTGTPPSNACVSIKVVYNDEWVASAGKGKKALAQQMARDVLKGAQDIYNTKFAPSNRLGTQITFNLVDSKTSKMISYFSSIAHIGTQTSIGNDWKCHLIK